ncbi:hydrolase [Staphylococcus piscifermentans]|uniref:Hydrolase n=1 Tax=Staphylococcus piscifermentans TaxID=70258 RepID=A0A239TWU3_9STAP|nr:carbon-nitrogen family hydrolase [Staphylococcus piscifermentans]RTX83387.1 carbon-nitrogen family hydrolase [Staphylococcus piscifermentans]GEP84656.1 hydrolase [Staphylococcus piscifermentans]SNV01374.1 hydrolase [Staphylococcus piscifermentans]
MKIQLFQFNIQPAETKANQKKIEALFSEQLDSDTEIAVIPEMWNNSYALDKLEQLADQDLQENFPFIQKLSQQYNVTIVAGSVSNSRNQQVYNTAFTVSNTGELLYQYDKIHLVPMLDEHLFLNGGQEVPYAFQLTPNVKASQIICYDLRFPEIARHPAVNGADILFYVAEWPKARLNHWRTLLQSRAIENDSFVVACNSCGFEKDGGTEYAGHSMVITPNGEILAEAGEQEETLTVDINLAEVTKQRENIPVFENRKPSLYKYDN